MFWLQMQVIQGQRREKWYEWPRMIRTPMIPIPNNLNFNRYLFKYATAKLAKLLTYA